MQYTFKILWYIKVNVWETELIKFDGDMAVLMYKVSK